MKCFFFLPLLFFAYLGVLKMLMMVMMFSIENFSQICVKNRFFFPHTTVTQTKQTKEKGKPFVILLLISLISIFFVKIMYINTNVMSSTFLQLIKWTKKKKGVKTLIRLNCSIKLRATNQNGKQRQNTRQKICS